MKRKMLLVLLTVISLSIISIIIYSKFQTKAININNMNEIDKIQIKLLNVSKLPQGNGYGLKLINTSSHLIKQNNVYLSYPIKITNGATQNKCQIEVTGNKLNIKPKEEVLLSVFIQKEAYNENNLDALHPQIEIIGYFNEVSELNRFQMIGDFSFFEEIRASNNSSGVIKGIPSTSSPVKNAYTFIDPNDVEWAKMQGGLSRASKALFKGHDDNTINKIVGKINSGTSKTNATDKDINALHSGARPRGILFKLKDGNEISVWTYWTSNSNKSGLILLKDRFILQRKENGTDRYYTVLSNDVGNYITNGSQVDMPVANPVSISYDSGKNVIRDGDKINLIGDGYTSNQITLFIVRNSDPKEKYMLDKVTTEFGSWEWNGVIRKSFKTYDGKDITLSNGLYNIIVDYGEGSYGLGTEIAFN